MCLITIILGFIVFTGDTKNKYESESGHYIAYRKYCQQWYFCSDNDVSLRTY